MQTRNKEQETGNKEYRVSGIEALNYGCLSVNSRMHTKRTTCLLLFMITMLSGLAQNQKTIVLSDSLRGRVDELRVTMGTAWMGKVWKIKFGAYGVGESKMGWLVTTNNTKILDRKTETSSKQKFSFELKGPSVDIGQVNAVTTINSEALHEWNIAFNSNGDVSLQEDAKFLSQSNSFTALMTFNSDTTDIWSLIMTTFKGATSNGHYTSIALLSNGKRKIDLVPVTSNDNGQDDRKIPAFGYELKENGIGLAALQFYGGGTLGMNKNIIWLPRDVDPRMKLILATALTAVLQYKMGQMEF
jgi:hypothetical protein